LPDIPAGSTPSDAVRPSWLLTPGIDGPLLIDAAMLVGYAIARTIGTPVAEGAWLVLAMVAGLRWPASGLGVAAVVAMTPQQVRAGMTPAVALVAASAIGFVASAALARLPGTAIATPIRIAVAGAAVLAGATFLAMTHALRASEPSAAIVATQRWAESAACLAVLVAGLRAAALGSSRALLLTVAGIAVALAVALIHQLVPTLLESGPLNWVLSMAVSSREVGSFASPNRLGTVAAVAAVVGLVLAMASGGPRRWWWGLFGVVAAVVLVLTFSRGALLGLTLAGATLIATRSWRAVAVYVTAVAAAGVVLVPLFVGGRLAGSGGTLGVLLANDAGRIEAWIAGIRMILAEPLFGHGFNAFARIGARYGATDGLQTAHSELINLWAEAGVLAAAGFLAIVLGLARAALDRRPDPWALAGLAALVVFVVASSFNVQSPFLAVMAPVWMVATYGAGRSVASGAISASGETVDSPPLVRGGTAPCLSRPDTAHRRSGAVLRDSCDLVTPT
jgi:O-antigen ligase